MRIASIGFLRRFLIGVIICVLLAVLGNYLHSRRVRGRANPKAPQILSSDMARSAEGIEYFQRRKGNVTFKIRAQRLLETLLGKNLLQGIEGYNLNPDGSVRNEIRSRNAEYHREGKFADFSGDVQILLGHGIELRTNSFHYDLDTNVGTTQDPLQFYSGELRGTARGARFDQKQESLELNHQVDFFLDKKNTKPDGSVVIEKLHAVSESAFCSETMNRILFRDNVRLESESAVLLGDEVEAILSADRRQVTSLTSTGKAAYRSKDASETRNLSGDRMVFGIDATNGVLQKISVFEQAAFSLISTSKEYDLRGDEIELDLDAAGELPTQIQSRTGVRFQLKHGMEQTTISGEQLQARITPETRNLESISVRQHAKMSTTGTAESGGNDLQAEEIELAFRKEARDVSLEKLRAVGSAQWISKPPQRTESTTQAQTRGLTASLLEMFYAREGNFLESANASGNVIMTETPAEPKASSQARRLLTDHVQFHFYPGNNQPKDMDAEGHVKVTYEKNAGTAGSSTMEGFRTASDKMRATFASDSGNSVLVAASQWGNFSYKDASISASAGKCDYDARMEILALRDQPMVSDEMGSTTGEQMDYDQKQKMLSVHHRVRSDLSSKKDAGSFFDSSSSSSPSIVLADEMQYWTESRRARYAGKVKWLSENQQLQAKELEIINGGDRVDAQGEIRHLVSREKTSDERRESKKGPQNDTLKDAGKSPSMPINILSSSLRYLKERNTVSYSGNVMLHSSDLDLASESLDAELDSENKAIQRATAREKVVVHQGNRECKGDRADYDLEQGKIEVTGNPAEIYDPGRGRSTARRLTSFTANDRILIENR